MRSASYDWILGSLSPVSTKDRASKRGALPVAGAEVVHATGDDVEGELAGDGKRIAQALGQDVGGSRHRRVAVSGITSRKRRIAIRPATEKDHQKPTTRLVRKTPRPHQKPPK